MNKPVSKPRVFRYRENARKKGGVILYAMLTSPEAIEAWKELQKIHGSNRDAIEDAIITTYEQMKEDK